MKKLQGKNNQQLVSIVMPVYNAGDFLCASLDSILAQTYKNWELIVVDDGSTDNSLQILQDYTRKDQRIRVYSQVKNQGVSRTANFALRQAQGKLIARMDADDVMYPQRIAKQVSFLKKNRAVVAVGGQCVLINEKDQNIGKKTFPTDNESIYRMMYRAMPVQQPTLMVNKSLLPKNFTWYEKEYTTAEEVDLLFRLFQYGKIANLDDFVLKYRLHQNNVSLVDPKKTFFLTYKTRKEAKKKYHYQPTFEARLINFLQWLAITILPPVAVYPLFALWRGVQPLKEFLPGMPKIKLSFTDLSINLLPKTWKYLNQASIFFVFPFLK